MSRRNSQRGLGDTVEIFTEATGIKKAVDWFSKITGIDCGCEERKERLNRLFSYKVKPKCLTLDQLQIIQALPSHPNKITDKQATDIAKIHADVFSHKYAKPCKCSPNIWRQWIGDLKTLEAEYAGETP